jgi:hypothetical protein
MILVHDDDFARLTGPAAADDDGFVGPYPSAAIAVLWKEILLVRVSFAGCGSMYLCCSCVLL